MEVSAEIVRSDHVRLNLFLLPRRRIHWVVFALFAVLMLNLLLTGAEQVGNLHVAVAVVLALLIAALLMALIFLLTIALMALAVSEKHGQLGPHVFALGEDGFTERTPVKEIFSRWQGIRSMHVTPSFLFVGITAYQYHVVPARAFASREAFESFCGRALALWKAAMAPR